MKLIVLIFLIMTSQSVWGQSQFIQECETLIKSNNNDRISRQISWLKIIYKTQDCAKLYDVLKKTKSFAEIIPNSELKRTHIQRGFHPFELNETLLTYNVYSKEWDESQNYFSNLTLFKEFKNLKHIVYESNKFQTRNLCQTLEQVPSLEVVTIPSWDLREEDIRCIENKKLDIYILGSFIPNKIFDWFRGKIVGISNFVGELEELHFYKRLKFLGLLSYNGRSSLKFLWSMRNLTHLNLNTIDVERLEDLSHLTSLLYITLNCVERNLSTTSVSQSDLKCKKNPIVNINFLEHLTWLRGLDISWNAIEDISAISKLKNLEHLSLRNNQIANISEIRNLKKLRFIDLSGNKITNLESLESLESIEYLNISSNQVRSLETISTLKNLTHFSAGNNPILHFDNFLPNIKLRALVLDSNVSELKYNTESFSPISFILSKDETYEKKYWFEVLLYEDLTKYYQNAEQHHQIKGFDSVNLKKLKNLEVLSLKGNGLTKLQHLSKINTLRYLDVSGNLFTGTKIINTLPNSLEYINLRNSISGQLSDIRFLDKLLMLDLGNNKIELTEIAFPRTMEFLKLDNCSITEVPNLSSAKNLYWVELQNNEIKEFYPQVLEELNHLNLQNNQLRSIPNFDNFPNLKNVILDGNNITNSNGRETLS